MHPSGQPTRTRKASDLVPQVAFSQGLQVLRGQDPDGLRPGPHRRGRPQRVGQVERLRRHPLGPRRAERQDASRSGDGGRDLLRFVRARARGRGRGHARARQRRPHAAHRLLRGGDHASHVPLGRVGVSHQRCPVAPHGRP